MSGFLNPPGGGAQTNQTLGEYAVGNTTAQSSSSIIDARSQSFDGAGIISVGLSGGSVVISATTPAQSNQTEGLYAVGNTTGQSSSSTVDARSISFDGAGVASVGMSGGSVVISVPAAAAQSAQTVGEYAVGNTTAQSSSSTIDARSQSFDGAGIVSVGLSGGSVVISATTPTQTNQTDGIYASQNTTGNSSSLTHDARSLTIEGLGAVSVGWSTNNSHLLISAPNTIAQTNQTEGLYASQNTTGNSSSLTYDARSLTIEGLGGVSIGWSTNNSHLLISGPAAQTNQTDGIYVSQNTTGNSSSLTHDARSLTVEGLGAVSVGWSTNNSHLLISAPNTIAQSNQTDGVYVSVNTTGNSSSLTYDARSLTIEGLGAVSVGWSTNNSHLLISSPVDADTWNVVSASGNTSGTLTSFSTGTIVLAGGANITLSQSSNTITISGGAGGGDTAGGIYATGNTTGTSSSSTYNLSSLSFTGAGNISLGWSSNTQFIISGPPEQSFFSNGVPLLGMDVTDNLVPLANTIASFAPFHINYPLAFSQLAIPLFVNQNNAGNTSSAGFKLTITQVYYTRNGSTLSAYISASSTFSTFAQSTSQNSLNGNRLLTASIAQTTLSPGDYWLGLYISTVTTGQTSLSNLIYVRPKNYWIVDGLAAISGFTAVAYGTGGTGSVSTGAAQADESPIFLPFGSAMGSSYGFQWDVGRGTITHGGSVASKAITDVSVSGSAWSVIEPCFQLRNWQAF